MFKAVNDYFKNYDELKKISLEWARLILTGYCGNLFMRINPHTDISFRGIHQYQI